MPYSYILEYLEPGERYCVEVLPTFSSISKALSSCSCNFTSRIEPRGGKQTELSTFLLGCVTFILLPFLFSDISFCVLYSTLLSYTQALSHTHPSCLHLIILLGFEISTDSDYDALSLISSTQKEKLHQLPIILQCTSLT